MRTNKTRVLVYTAVLSGLGALLNLIEITYPLVPFLNFDASEVVILVTTTILGIVPTFIVAVVKGIISLIIKGNVGNYAIGQITAFIASMSIGISYYLARKKFGTIVSLIICVASFTTIMVVCNYLFITPIFFTGDLVTFKDVEAKISLASFGWTWQGFDFLSPYANAIIFVYTPFNLLKGLLIAVVFVPIERLIKNSKINLINKI